MFFTNHQTLNKHTESECQQKNKVAIKGFNLRLQIDNPSLRLRAPFGVSGQGLQASAVSKSLPVPEADPDAAAHADPEHQLQVAPRRAVEAEPADHAEAQPGSAPDPEAGPRTRDQLLELLVLVLEELDDGGTLVAPLPPGLAVRGGRRPCPQRLGGDVAALGS